MLLYIYYVSGDNLDAGINAACCAEPATKMKA